MKKFIQSNLISFSIVFVGILISVAILSGPGLDVLEKIFSIAGSSSLGFALATYLHERKRDKTIATIDQISFFRKEIIPAYNLLSQQIKKKDPSYNFPRAVLVGQDFPATIRKYPKEMGAQWLIIRDMSDIQDEQILIFNMLEEFALKVLHFETGRHEALASVRDVFIQAIEQNAVGIFNKRLIAGDNIYLATLQLYHMWAGIIDRTSPEERAKKLTQEFTPN